MDYKICSKCPEKGQQPIGNFAIKGKGRHNCVCKTCKRLYNLAHYTKNKKNYMKRAKKRRADFVNWLRDLKSTLSCSKCPENHPATIQFHHRDPKSKDIDIAHAIRHGWTKARILHEIEKCDILCANCHFKEHWNLKRPCPDSNRDSQF